MNLTDSAYNSVNLADLPIHFTNAVDVLYIHLQVAAASANANNFMSSRQGADRSFANSTGGTDDNYLHNVLSSRGSTSS
jgi:hypothetical protein